MLQLGHALLVLAAESLCAFAAVEEVAAVIAHEQQRGAGVDAVHPQHHREYHRPLHVNNNAV